jgi:Leucine-rich repeat (LRR) protein
MKNFYFTLFILFFCSNAGAQIINIPDPNFKAKLLEASPSNYIAFNFAGERTVIDTNSNGEIELSEAALIETLIITNANITSLAGIESFVNLNQLDFSNNQMNQFNPSILPNLTLLWCANNQITSLDLTNNLALQDLDCSHNIINQINLPDFTYGISANIGFNELYTIDLSNLSKIVTLYLNNNHLSNVAFNNPNPYLYDGGIDLSNNPLVTLDMNQLHNSPVMMGEPYDAIALNNTLLRQIICPPAFLKYYYISNNTNLEIISFKNELLENFVDNGFDTAVTIQNNANLNAICVDALDGVSQNEQQFFESYFNSSAIIVSTTTCNLDIEDDELLSSFFYILTQHQTL